MSQPMPITTDQIRAFCLERAITWESDNEEATAETVVSTAQRFADFVLAPVVGSQESTPEGTS